MVVHRHWCAATNIDTRLHHNTTRSPDTLANSIPDLKNMKLSPATLLILALVFTFSDFQSATATPPTGVAASVSVSVYAPSGFGCNKKCELRCSRSGRRDRCLDYCGICCGKCSGCVPAGPFADKAQCPCYRDMKSTKGTNKCP